MQSHVMISSLFSFYTFVRLVFRCHLNASHCPASHCQRLIAQRLLGGNSSLQSSRPLFISFYKRRLLPPSLVRSSFLSTVSAGPSVNCPFPFFPTTRLSFYSCTISSNPRSIRSSVYSSFIVSFLSLLSFRRPSVCKYHHSARSSGERPFRL